MRDGNLYADISHRAAFTVVWYDSRGIAMMCNVRRRRASKKAMEVLELSTRAFYGLLREQEQNDV